MKVNPVLTNQDKSERDKTLEVCVSMIMCYCTGIPRLLMSGQILCIITGFSDW